MKTKNLFIPLLAAGFMASIPSVHASLVTGYVWTDATSAWKSLASPAGTVPTAPPSTGSAVGTLSGDGPLNFFVDAPDSNPLYTISGFLSTGGYSYSGTDGTLNNTLFEFTGFTYLTTGQTIHLWDDDGVILSINGSTVISEPQAQSVGGSQPYTYTWTGADGVYSFDLLYAEVFGAPATLKTDLNVSVPEPSTVVAGALLLLPFGVSTVRILRKKKQA